MRQTWALFFDAYRQLNARKLFWLTLFISGVIVAAFGAVGLNETGISLLWWDIENDVLNSTIWPVDVFYKVMFTSFGVNIWLAWIATILALVSTAGMIPEMVGDGSIDLLLSKKLGRTRLFLTKYATGLLFVALQVLVFSGAAFFVLGLRAGVWEPGLFLAVPLIVVFFSYLFCVCALIGLMTRSTIAALMLTLIFWFFLFALNSADQTLVGLRTMREAGVEQRIENRERAIEITRAEIDALNSGEDTSFFNRVSAPMRISAAERRIEQQEAALEEDRARLVEFREGDGGLNTWSRGIVRVKTALPKTSETIELLRRSMIDASDLPTGDFSDGPPEPRAEANPEPRIDEETLSEEALSERFESLEGEDFRGGGNVGRAAQEELDSRSPLWIIGTSMIFQAVVLAFACWRFERRDF